MISRHDALVIGDMDVDYVFFGRVDRAEDMEPDKRAIALAQWWSPIVELPCVAMAGTGIASVEAAAETGAEFVGVRGFVWDAHDGPADAIRKANEILDQYDAD